MRDFEKLFCLICIRSSSRLTPRTASKRSSSKPRPGALEKAAPRPRPRRCSISNTMFGECSTALTAKPVTSSAPESWRRVARRSSARVASSRECSGRRTGPPTSWLCVASKAAIAGKAFGKSEPTITPPEMMLYRWRRNLKIYVVRPTHLLSSSLQSVIIIRLTLWPTL